MSATTAITGLTVIISLIGLFLWSFEWSPFQGWIEYFALKPDNIIQGKYLWTLLTHTLVHGSVFHLIVNMFVLVSLGGFCEKIIGRKRFIWFYFGSGVFAGLFSALLSGFLGYGAWANVFGTPDLYMVGASGAIFAIAGLFTVILPRLKFSIIFLPFFSLPAFVMIPLVLVLTWVASIIFGFSIGNAAHFGGFIIGLIYGFYLRTKYPKKIIMLSRYFG